MLNDNTFNMFVFDISRVIGLLTPRSPKSIIDDRVKIRIQNTGAPVDQYQQVYKAVENDLIDSFFKFSIASFDVFWVRGTLSYTSSKKEVDWFMDNTEARSCLWNILNKMPVDCAGKFVEYHRCANTIWLAVPMH